jgi:hypothetical protein
MTAPRDPAVAAARVAAALEEAGIDYAIGGALALAAHGMPRATLDADLGAFIEESRLEELLDALERAGCLFERERARRDVARAFLFVVRCAGVLVDVFVNDPRHAARERRVKLAGPDGKPLWFFSAEDWAVHKLALHRAQDVADLERLFAVRGPELDLAYVRRWVEVIAPAAADPRRVTFEDLVRRFAARRD